MFLFGKVRWFYYKALTDTNIYHGNNIDMPTSLIIGEMKVI